jgi:hypothetical protein
MGATRSRLPIFLPCIGRQSPLIIGERRTDEGCEGGRQNQTQGNTAAEGRGASTKAFTAGTDCPAQNPVRSSTVLLGPAEGSPAVAHVWAVTAHAEAQLRNPFTAIAQPRKETS